MARIECSNTEFLLQSGQQINHCTIQDYYAIKTGNQLFLSIVTVWVTVKASKITICSRQKPILRTHHWHHCCSLWSNATCLNFYHNILNTTLNMKSLINDTSYYSKQQDPRQPSPLTRQCLKITKVSLT